MSLFFAFEVRQTAQTLQLSLACGLRTLRMTTRSNPAARAAAIHPVGPAAGSPLLVWRGGAALELGEPDIPAVQAFWEASPGYLLAVEGHPPRPHEGRDFVCERELPAGIRCSREHVFAYRNAAGDIDGLGAMAVDLLAPGVWHLGLFVAAARLHGSGWAQQAYAATEDWAFAGGALWMRLGVALANRRGHAFWRRQGYREVKRREGVRIGDRTHTLVTMVKPLRADLADYLAAVARDR